MKKIAKLSLVAAVAVVGFTSANAQSLEEAIKGVDVSGTAAYRYDDRDSNDSNLTNNSYKVAVNLKSSVNDDLTFNSRTIIGAGTKANDMAVLGVNGSDDEAGFGLSHANFAYTGLANTTVIAGKQAVPSPFAVQADAAGDEDSGTGITAITAVGPVTVAATYLNQTNLNTGADQRAAFNAKNKTTDVANNIYTSIDLGSQAVAGLGLMADVGPVALDAWYLDMAETSATNDGHQAYTLGAKTAVEMVKLYARYSAVDHDATNEAESLWKIGASTKVGIVSASLDYGQTNDVDTVVSGVGITGDADADVNLQAWALSLNQKDDASLIKATVGVDLMSNLNLSATYADLQVNGSSSDKFGAATDGDASEYYGQLTYKMGKNFMTYARLGQTDFDAKTESGTRGRLHVQYTF